MISLWWQRAILIWYSEVQHHLQKLLVGGLSCSMKEIVEITIIARFCKVRESYFRTVSVTEKINSWNFTTFVSICPVWPFRHYTVCTLLLHCSNVGGQVVASVSISRNCLNRRYRDCILINSNNSLSLQSTWKYFTLLQYWNAANGICLSMLLMLRLSLIFFAMLLTLL